jgi:hypothetical protein
VPHLVLVLLRVVLHCVELICLPFGIHCIGTCITRHVLKYGAGAGVAVAAWEETYKKRNDSHYTFTSNSSLMHSVRLSSSKCR